MKKYVHTALLASIMMGCGGTSNSVSIGTGYYVDSAVYGAEYRCGNQEGMTNGEGKFLFEVGKGCIFSVNEHPFKVVDKALLTKGVTIQETDTKIAQFLQTLDKDGDPDNGIEIDKDVVKVISQIPKTDAQFSTLNTLLKTVTSYEGEAVSAADAEAHLGKNIGILTPKATVSASVSNQGDDITLSASSSTLTKGEIKTYEWQENGVRLSRQKEFTKDDFTLGAHTVKLTITDSYGRSKSTTVGFQVKTGDGVTDKWTGIAALSSNGANKLFVTSDDNNIYLKYEADASISAADISTAQFYLNADDSNLTGLKSGKWQGEYFEYLVKEDGVYHLQNEKDYDGVKVQDMNYTVNNHVVEAVVDKGSLDTLVQDIAITMFLRADSNQSVPTASPVPKFHDTHYVEKNDTAAPIVSINGANLVVLDINEAYTELGATAVDVKDGEIATVTTDDSSIDTAIPGYYTVTYTARDTANNVGHAYRNIQVRGKRNTTTLERKNLGFNESVIINHEAGQVWADDDVTSHTSTRGCLVVGTGATGLQTTLEEYCANSNYAGFTDWRAPTSLELSRYTIQMWQEGKTPGMARKGCVQTLAIDNNSTVKAVWTHIKNQPGRIATNNLTPAGGRCVRGAVNNNLAEFSISDGIMIDNEQNLTWVSENDASTHACLAIHAPSVEQNLSNSSNITPAKSSEQYNTSKGFCASNPFKGGNWRDPKPAELENFIKRTNALHILPGYLAPCKVLLAREDNGSEYAVSTRFKSGVDVGTITPLAVSPLTGNIGLRCVRNGTN